MQGTLDKLEKVGGKTIADHENRQTADPSAPQSYFEIKCIGPDDQVIDISTAGWVGAD
jgi:hypothetical protein